MEMVKQKLVVVLGMHRSGTSTITRGLKVMGVDLGDRMMVPVPGNNDKGFWEDVDLNKLNIDILLALGLDWQYLKPIDQADLHFLRENGYFLQAVELLRQKVKNIPVFGFKDPRVSKLLPFWKEVFSHCQFDVSYVFALRNPLSVAQSLAKRNYFVNEHSYLLWLEHVMTSVVESIGAKRVIVDFDEMVQNPERELNRMAAHLDLAINQEQLRDFKSEFLDQSLRHNVNQSNDLLEDKSCPSLVREIYFALLDIASEKSKDDSPQFLKKLQDWLKEFGDLKSTMLLLDPFIAGHAAVELKLNEKITALSELTGKNQSLTVELRNSVDQNNLFSAQILELKHELHNLNNDFRAQSNQLAIILNSKSWFITKPLRFTRRNFSTAPTKIVRELILGPFRIVWYLVPLSVQKKQEVAEAIHKRIPTPLRNLLTDRRSDNELAANSQDLDTMQINAKLVLEKQVSYVPLLQGQPLKHLPVKLICFYLPQFHAIPENDAWWGEGFTEWINVLPAKPVFYGHYQPHIPGELGAYNLLDKSTQKRQVELAKLYGVEGFCFYFYWFGGKRLLEAPTENYLNDQSLDLPFCLCWANENWSRRWDGLDNEILISQQHSPEDDIAFISYLSKYLSDARYIRIDGKPLLLVYRPQLLISAKETAGRWRDWCRSNGVGEIFLAYTQSFETCDPADYGFDAAIEFPPNKSLAPILTKQAMPLTEEFAATVYDWSYFVRQSERYKQPDYELFRSVCPAWDNTARRKNKGAIFANSSPALYRRWLSNAISNTVRHAPNSDHQLVFVNAWNEWAEGAHLEPDERYGYAYLQATRDALSGASEKNSRPLLIVTHDCHPHGAQFLILETARKLRDCGITIFIVALGGGPLMDDFTQIGETLNCDLVGPEDVKEFLLKLSRLGVTDAITSSVVSGSFVPLLKEYGFQVLSLIHELPGVIKQMKQERNAALVAQFSDQLVFPAQVVFEKFKEFTPVNAEKVKIRPQGVVRQNPFKFQKEHAHQLICKKHDLDPHSQIVLSVAYMDLRKGPDLFVEMAVRVLKIQPNTSFIWVGHTEQAMEQKIVARINELGLSKKIILAGFVRDPLAYYAAASVYALTSREDPFPNVVLESVEVGVPVVAFDGTTGASAFIIEHGGKLAKALDTGDFGNQVGALLSNPVADIKSDVSLKRYALDLLHYLNGFQRVSVVVPNYNYQNYIESRLASIFNQKYPIYEVIILDDASTDQSVKVIRDYLEKTGNEAVLHANSENSGSVFKQWEKGCNLSHGDLVWIAEADDLAEEDFLSELAPIFEDEKLVLAYCQSKQMDSNGKVTADNYLDYALDTSNSFHTDYCRDGRVEIVESMCIKNTIPNVSAVLFSRTALTSTFNEIQTQLTQYKVAGDWLVYLYVLVKGKISHNKKSLNSHRRHTSSVTNSTQFEAHLQEVIDVQKVAFTLVPAPPDKIQAAENYVAKLCVQFKLPQRKGDHLGKEEVI